MRKAFSDAGSLSFDQLGAASLVASGRVGTTCSSDLNWEIVDGEGVGTHLLSTLPAAIRGPCTAPELASKEGWDKNLGGRAIPRAKNAGIKTSSIGASDSWRDNHE